jgi:hypothetical protein
MASKFNDFCFYLAGLWEGNGHSGNPPSPYVAITFHEKDYPLCIACQHLLNGRVRHKKHERAWVLIIQKQKDLFRFTQLIGDKLRSPKATEIWQIAQWLEKKSKDSLLVSSLNYSLDKTPLMQNAWFAGFIDADGGFKVRFTQKKVDPLTKKLKTKERIALSFIIEQRMFHMKSGYTMKPFIENIADFLTIPLSSRKHNGKNYHCVELSSFQKILILIEYLQIYPLYSSKYLDYENWLQVYQIMVNKGHLTEEGKQIISNIKSKMNRKRSQISCKHLLRFFSLVVIEMEVNTSPSFFY